uniref:G-protein coupled receptors family 1 profile domain-containing protein n=1 Tax=Knipowitschia caucasica TaxID=637954 RepID=A0AAV2LKI0_KNICA
MSLVQAISVSASVLTLTVISVNRYYSVRSPLRARSMFTRRRILLTVAVVWAVSSLMCAPLAVINRRREISFETFAIPVCHEEWPEQRLKQGCKAIGRRRYPGCSWPLAVRKPGASSPPCYATPGRHGGIPVSRGQRMVRGPIMGPFLKGGGVTG